MKKIFKFSKVSKKVTKRILILMTVIMIVLFCVLVPLEVRLVNQQIEANEKQMRTVAFEALDKTLLNLQDSVAFLSTVKIVSLQQNHTAEDYKNYLNMKNQILAVGRINNYISNIYLSNGEEQFVLNMNKQINNAETTYDSILSQAGESIFKTYNFEILKIFNGKTNEYYFHYVMPNLSNNSVLLQLEQKSFSKEIFDELDNTLYQAWIDSSGDVVFSSSSADVGTSFSEIFFNESLEHGVERKKVNFNEEKGYLTITDESQYSFQLVTVIKAQNYQETYQVIYFGIGLVFLLLGFVFVVTVIIINTAYAPFKDILDLLDKPERIDIPEEDNAEYNYIVSNIRRIVSENKELNLQMQETLEKFREQQFVARQMQISPHFLFNTLSSISGLSVITLSDLGNPITEAINNLANILSEVLLSQSKVVTIRKEIELTKLYIQILLLRYNNRFTVEWDVDDSLMNEFIIKLSLQPIIENAVQHAFDWSDKEAKIRISMACQNDLITVSIEDNGIGISAEQLEDLEYSMNDFSNTDKKIGLRNTNHRIKLLYGEQYGIQVSSTKTQGTRFSFSYPKK